MTELKPDEMQDVATSATAVPKLSSGRHALNILTTRLFTLPLMILTSVMVVRVLGPAQRGIYEFLVLQGALILPLLMLGFNASATYFVAKKRYTVNDIFATCLTVGWTQGMLGTVLLGLLWYWGWLGTTAADTRGSLMIPILLTLPLQSTILSLTRLALGDSWFTLNNRVQLAIALLTSALMWSLVIIGGFGVQGTVIALVTTNLLVLIGILAAFFRRYRPKFALRLDYLREAWQYGLKAWVADVAVTTNGRLDKYVLGVVEAPEKLGVYGPIVLITEMLWLLPDSIAFVLQNKIASARDTAEQVKLVERMNRLVFWIVAVGAVMVTAIAPSLMAIVWGPNYAGSRDTMALLMPGTVAYCVAKVLTKFFAGTGRPHHSGTTVVVGAFASFGLYVLLIPWLGIAGAAIAHSACYTVTSIAAVVIYRKLVDPHSPRLFLPEMADATWIEQQARLAMRSRRHAGG